MGAVKLLSSPLKGHEMKQKQNNSIPDWLRLGSTVVTLPIARFQGGGDEHAIGAKPSIELLMKGTIIWTWNVYTLHACGKLYELIYELN